MALSSLSYANLKRTPGRTVGLVLLCALLAFSLFAGIMATSSLRNGLTSLAARLGADIIVAPADAKSKVNLQDVLLDGTPGQFYMDKAFVEKVAAIEGVEKVSPQYFLATVKAGCCTMPVQIIGFDPASDFSIQPWVTRSFASDLEREDVVTGSNVSGAPGSTITFYGVDCRIVSRLDETGTALDNAVFATNETLQDLIAGSQDQGISVLASNSPEQVVSTVQVKVAEGRSVADVAGQIDLRVRGVDAVQTRTMISGVADSMEGVSRMVGLLAAVLGLLAVAFLVVACVVLSRGRMREFAVLRMAGATRFMLAKISIIEAALESVLGAALGIGVSLVLFSAFGRLLESTLSVPFLTPDAAHIALFAVLAGAATVVACCLATGLASRRLTSVDAGYVLREG